jgi:hypothetical protein
MALQQGACELKKERKKEIQIVKCQVRNQINPNKL